MRYTLFVSALIGLTLAACSRVQTADNNREDVSRYLRIDIVHSAPFSTTYTTVGTLRAEAGKIAEVGLPMDGRIGTIHKRLSDPVRVGTPLFSVCSPGFADQCKSYFQAESNYQFQQKTYARQQVLHETGIVSDREWEETTNNLELARRELKQWEYTIRALGIDIAGLKESGELNIVSPIKGEIVRMELTPGQYVRQDSPALITIADLSTVWVAAQIKEHYLDRIHYNDSVEVFLNNDRHFHVTGQVVYIGQLLDPETRSIEVLISCANPQRELKPGMFAHVHFTSEPTEAIQVPASAILQDENTPFVYVQAEDSSFVRRPVTVESGDSGMVHIISGLEEGERIVAEGGLYLN